MLDKIFDNKFKNCFNYMIHLPNSDLFYKYTDPEKKKPERMT